jgi:hypothetical protein
MSTSVSDAFLQRDQGDQLSQPRTVSEVFSDDGDVLIRVATFFGLLTPFLKFVFVF